MDDHSAGERQDFLTGGGQMGERMRAHDWSTSPLGSPQDWPQSLRTAVSIMLNSGHPMFLAWGPELGFVYNDAYASILGDKHPDALGRRFEQIWADIWSDIQPLVATAMSGEATWSEDLYLHMFRRGYWEDTWWTFSYSPIRDESGGVGGMFCACTEQTGKVLGERRLSFQVELAERLRAMSDPAEIKSAACTLLGETLQLGRAGYAEADASGEYVDIQNDWSLSGMPPLHGRFRLTDFGDGLAEAMRAGQTLVVEDVAEHPATAANTEAFKGIGVASLLAVPLLKQGRLAAILSAHMPIPRQWTDDEIAMAREVVERTWSSVRRAVAENALRENEERLRLVQGAGHIGSFDWDMRTGAIHRSPEYLALQGLPPGSSESGAYSDDWLDRVHPDDRARVLQRFEDDRARTGPYDLEYRIVRPSDGQVRWIHNRGRIDADANGKATRLLSVQTDVTERKRDEVRQRLLINELNHRVKNTLATIQSIAGQTLRNADSLPQARADFENRLLALSRAHDILTRQTWEGAALSDVVAAAAEPYGDGRVNWAGPHLDVPPQMALSISMALHELATNAVKYGALSAPDGRVGLAWTAKDGRLSMIWRESGGPPVTPPARRGFGARLIETGLARELNGEVAIEFARSGVVCTIDAPLHPAPAAL